MMAIDLTTISQAGIFVFGCSAIWFVGRKDLKTRRWGYVLGMLGQPFWFMATIPTKQWGMVAVSVWYAYAWGQGLYNHWIAPEKSDSRLS